MLELCELIVVIFVVLAKRRRRVVVPDAMYTAFDDLVNGMPCWNPASLFPNVNSSSSLTEEQVSRLFVDKEFSTRTIEGSRVK